MPNRRLDECGHAAAHRAGASRSIAAPVDTNPKRSLRMQTLADPDLTQPPAWHPFHRARGSERLPTGFALT